MIRTAFTFVPNLLQVPVGRETLGRIMNVIGEPVDECGPIGGVLCCDSLSACSFTYDSTAMLLL